MSSTPRARVLAVDDAPSNLVALDAVLGDTCELVRARSGPEAIATLERDANFDVILMDIQMPGMDGYEAAQRIKGIPDCAEIPLVFVTAVYGEDPHVRRGYAVGAVDYFTKPFDAELLRRKVIVYASFRQRAALSRLKEEQLRQSRNVLRAGRALASALEGLPVGVIIADTSARICQTNEEAQRIVGHVRAQDEGACGEVLARWDYDKLGPENGRAAIARCLETGEASNEVVRIARGDGTTRNVLESISPLRGLDGRIVGAVVVLQDRTEPKRVEADLEERITRLASLGP